MVEAGIEPFVVDHYFLAARVIASPLAPSASSSSPLFDP
jgi:hypothetical protein